MDEERNEISETGTPEEFNDSSLDNQDDNEIEEEDLYEHEQNKSVIDDSDEEEYDEEDNSDSDESPKEQPSGNKYVELSEEELDQVADTAIAALEDILKYFNLGEITIDEYEGDEGELILDITGEDLAVLIGRHGKTLDALQFLISSITARTMGFRYPVVIDVEGYKGRQRQKLEGLAFSTAKRALSQNKSMKMRPMTPYERRIIHVALREFEGVSTASEGEGSARHVVVIPN